MSKKSDKEEIVDVIEGMIFRFVFCFLSFGSIIFIFMFAIGIRSLIIYLIVLAILSFFCYLFSKPNFDDQSML